MTCKAENYAFPASAEAGCMVGTFCVLLCVILEAVHNDTILNCAASVFILGSVPVIHLECLSGWPEKKGEKFKVFRL